jgi:hypothetical protein
MASFFENALAHDGHEKEPRRHERIAGCTGSGGGEGLCTNEK